jgi:DNA-binding LytR/AlgR family response regulator
MLRKPKYNLLFLDDHPNTLNFLLTNLPNIYFIGEYIVESDPMQAQKILNDLEIDILFLDMDFGDYELNGNTWFRLLKDPPVTISCSKFSDFMYESREVGIKIFMGKHSSYEVLYETLYDAAVEVDRRAEKRKRDIKEFEVRDTSGEDIRIIVDEIFFARIDNNILTIFLKDRRVTSQMSLKAFAQKLPEELFAKPHNSYLVSLGKIIMHRGGEISFYGGWEEEGFKITQQFSKTFRIKYETFQQHHASKLL